MSYILDALRKAERDRQPTRIPTLATVHAPVAAHAARRWPWIIAALLVVNIAVVTLVLREPRPDVAPLAADTRATSTTVAPPAQRPESNATNVPTPTAPAPTAAPTRERTGQSDRLMAASAAPASRSGTTAPSLSASAPPPGSSPMTSPSSTTARVATITSPERTVQSDPSATANAQQPPRSAATAPSQTTPAKPAAPRLAILTPAEQAPSAPATQGLPPSLQEMSAPLRESVGPLKLEVLYYSDIAEDRIVFINGRKYVEGQTIDGPGESEGGVSHPRSKVVVEKIARDGAVLSYQGQRFLLRQ